MGIGYAILSQTLTINGIGNVKGNWNVEITGGTGTSADPYVVK